MVVAASVNPWLDRAGELADLIREWRDVGERERQLPQPLFEAMRDGGLFRLMLPRQYGGEEAPATTVFPVIEEIARQDGAAGWNLMIGVGVSRLSEGMPESGALQTFGADPDTPLAGSFAQVGKATVVEGGYRLSGRWAFASGCQHAQWLVAGGTVLSVAPTADGRPPERRFFVLPAAECEILDTWTTAGLRGTGSHDFQVADAFVPTERSFTIVPSVPA